MNKISTSESSSRLAVTYRPVGDLIPDPRNARTHPKRQIDQIRTSIEAFGFTNPIGQTISDVASQLRAGTLSPAGVPITVTENGLIANTRSSLALMQAGVPQS